MTFLKKIKKIKNRKCLKVLISWAFVVIFIFLVPGRSVSAATEKMTFNLWGLYDNSFTYGFASSVSNGDIFYCSNSGNSVSVDSKSNTKIKNTESYFSYCDINYIHSFYLRTYDDLMKPRFLISEKFLNQPIEFTVTHKATLTNARFSGSYNFNPSFEFYVGTKDNYNIVSCDLSSTFLEDSDFSSYYIYQYTFIVTFKEVGYICGFYFNLESDTDIGVKLDSISSNPTLFCECTLSPLVFDAGITAEDIQNSVSGGILDATGGNNYDGFDNSTSDIFFDKEGAISEISNNLLKDNSVDFSFTILSLYPQLVSTMRGLSAFVDDHVMRLPFLRVTLYMSLGLGCLGFLLGLAQFVVSRPNTKTSSGKKQKGKKGD